MMGICESKHTQLKYVHLWLIHKSWNLKDRFSFFSNNYKFGLIRSECGINTKNNVLKSNEFDLIRYNAVELKPKNISSVYANISVCWFHKQSSCKQTCNKLLLCVDFGKFWPLVFFLYGVDISVCICTLQLSLHYNPP